MLSDEGTIGQINRILFLKFRVNVFLALIKKSYNSDTRQLLDKLRYPDSFSKKACKKLAWQKLPVKCLNIFGKAFC